VCSAITQLVQPAHNVVSVSAFLSFSTELLLPGARRLDAGVAKLCVCCSIVGPMERWSLAPQDAQTPAIAAVNAMCFVASVKLVQHEQHVIPVRDEWQLTTDPMSASLGEPPENVLQCMQQVVLLTGFISPIMHDFSDFPRNQHQSIAGSPELWGFHSKHRQIPIPFGGQSSRPQFPGGAGAVSVDLVAMLEACENHVHMVQQWLLAVALF
jgi:hypothetical protein